MKRWSLLATAVFIVLPSILYAPFLFGGKVLYWGVYLLQFYPWRRLAVEQIRAGHWPLWNPYLGAGTPLAANLQTAVFYPSNILFLLIPVERAFGWELALHVALAGLFACYLGRTLALSRFGALVIGVSYSLGGYIVARWVFPSMVYAAAWLPLMLALAERLIRRASPDSQSGSRHWIVDIALLALAVALQLLAGHAQTSFYSLVIVAAFALFRLFQQQDRNGKNIRSSLLVAGGLLLSVLWGAVLAAIQLLPTAEMTAQSQRAGTLTDMTFAYELSFWPWRLISLLAPDFFGNPARNEYWAFGTYWEEAAYVGILPLMLVVLAVLARWQKRRATKTKPLSLVPFFTLLSLVAVVLALGNHTPLYPLIFRYVPGFGLFQAPARLMIGYALGIAVLAGIGAETIRITARTRTVLQITAIVGLGIGIAGVAARLAMPAIRVSFGNSIIRLGLTLALAAGLLLLRGRRLPRGQWQMLVIAFIAADLLAFGWGLAPGTEQSVYHTPVSTAEFLQTQPPGRLFVAEPYAQNVYDQYVSLSAFSPADPAYLQGLRESQLPNLNSIHHLYGVGNYDPLTVGTYRDLYDLLTGESDMPLDLDKTLSILNLFGVRYVITDDELDLPLLYDKGPHIYRNDETLPAALVVYQARVVKDRETRLDTLRTSTFDPRTTVLLSHLPSQPLPLPTGGVTKGQISQPEPTILREGPDRVTIQVDMTQPGYLVLSDVYYPGWQATVDGKPSEILPANHAFRAVILDEGKHTIVFEYKALSFRTGAWLTIGTTLLLVTALIVGWLRGGSRPTSDLQSPTVNRRVA